MEPVRVKLYGFVSMTKRRYVLQVTVVVLLLIGLLAVWYFHWPAVREGMAGSGNPLLDRVVAFWDAAPWVVLVFSGLQLVEAFFTFRAFSRKESKSQALPSVATGPSVPQ